MHICRAMQTLHSVHIPQCVQRAKVDSHMCPELRTLVPRISRTARQLVKTPDAIIQYAEANATETQLKPQARTHIQPTPARNLIIECRRQ